LARAPDLITFADIIRSIDGPLALTPCTSRNAYQKCADCIDESICAIRKTMVEVREATAGILEQTTLARAARLEDPAEAEGEKRSGSAA
jgi:DNA-binding IscR family transcriptional regulator